MFTLVLCFPIGRGGRALAQESISSGHVPQLGSTLNMSSGFHSGTWKVAHVGQTVTDGVMESTVYVYLEETD